VAATRRTARHWIEHVADWRDEPMAYWVHVEQDGVAWRSSASYRPPAPVAEGRKGYPVLCIESQGVVLRFSSAAQLAEGIAVLARRPLPTSKRLSALRGGGHGPNSHWLSRLPVGITSPKPRRRVVEDLRAVWLALPADSPFKSTAEVDPG
jgi:hypothetical protein